MNGMTDHSFSSLYREPKICNIAAYLSNVHACGPYYINFQTVPLSQACAVPENTSSESAPNRRN